jgi:hypothetical protein
MTAAFSAAASMSHLSLSPAIGGTEAETAPLSPEPAFPASRPLTASEVRDLLAASPAPDPAVAKLALTSAYRLAGGEALLVFGDGTGRLYESRAELLDIMDAMAGGHLQFFADEQDVRTLLSRLNGDPDVAFIIPDGPLPPAQPMPPRSLPPRTLEQLEGSRSATIVMVTPCIDTGHRQRWRAARPVTAFGIFPRGRCLFSRRIKPRRTGMFQTPGPDGRRSGLPARPAAPISARHPQRRCALGSGRRGRP